MKKQNPKGNDLFLKRQAEEVRSLISNNYPVNRRDLSPWQKILTLPILFFFLLGSAFLLLSEDVRRRIVAKVSLPIFDPLFNSSTIYSLPPPETKVERDLQVVTQVSVPKPNSISDSQDISPKLKSSSYLDPINSEAMLEEKDSEWKKAFTILTENSELVRQLISNEVKGLVFEGWEPLRVKSDQYSIKLNVRNNDTSLVGTFAWSVNLLSGETRPESQAARDLFFKTRRK